MRATISILPLLAVAAPASAQVAPPPPAMVISPAAADKVANALDAVTDALLDVKVGKLEAAIDGRPATAAERQMTVRDMASAKDPNFERNLHRTIAQARPIVRQGIQSVDEAVPQVMQGIQQASRAIERATANMPDPTYPRR
ncbi:hypothetical protein [Sphingomonas sp.]|uniref:hypothetical protein n=1 Tax=Sphingomonas sp. TaxID=28214 RepID=UPI0025F48B09|nr:hypothetical protein [Sphingomonas sp.]MBV9529212.1 hypothetical protein [Sphingomonas sp.]